MEQAEADRMGMGIGLLMVWLGEERGDPAPWVCRKQDMPLVYFHKKCPHTFSKVSGPMLKKMVMTTFQNRSKPQETKETPLNLSAGVDCLRELSYII